MLLTCVGIGSMFSLAVFLQPIATDTGWSRSGISMAATLDFLFMGAASFVWGALSDRFGTRVVVLSGSVLLGTGLIAASRATALFEFQLLFGVLIGVAIGSYYAPMIAAATAWLAHRRNLAAALVSAGMGIGSMTISPLAAWLLTSLDWRSAMLIIGAATWALLIPTSLLVRPPPRAAQGTDAAAPALADTRASPLTGSQALLTPQFAVLALTHFACCAAHSGPLFHMVSYVAFCGVPALLAVSVFGLAGLSGLGGRITLGLIADRVGTKPTLVAGLLVQALAISAYLFVGALGEFYALSVVFGLAYGGVMPLYALVTREYFGESVMGAAYGGVFLVSTLGMGLGSFAGGVLYDRLGSYAWLYAGSFAIGAAAVLLALSFRAPPALAVPATAH